MNYTEEKICYIPNDHTCANVSKSKPGFSCSKHTQRQQQSVRASSGFRKSFNHISGDAQSPLSAKLTGEAAYFAPGQADKESILALAH